MRPRALLGELMTLSQTQESDEDGNTSSSFSSPLGTQGCFVLLMNWYPQLFRPKLRPSVFYFVIYKCNSCPRTERTWLQVTSLLVVGGQSASSVDQAHLQSPVQLHTQRTRDSHYTRCPPSCPRFSCPRICISICIRVRTGVLYQLGLELVLVLWLL